MRQAVSRGWEGSRINKLLGARSPLGWETLTRGSGCDETLGLWFEWPQHKLRPDFGFKAGPRREQCNWISGTFFLMRITLTYSFWLSGSSYIRLFPFFSPHSRCVCKLQPWAQALPRSAWSGNCVYDSIVKPMCNLDAILWSFNTAEEALNTYKSKRKQEPHAAPYVTHTYGLALTFRNVFTVMMWECIFFAEIDR